MIRDALLQFDNPASLGLGTGTYNSSNVLDLHMAGIPVLALGAGARDMGIGDDPALKLHVLVTTAFTTSASGTLQVILQGATDNGSGAPGTYFTMLQSPTYAVASLGAGQRVLDVDVPRPPAGQTFPRFLRLQYVIATGAMTAGALISEIVIDRFDQPEQVAGTLGGYPPGITIAN